MTPSTSAAALASTADLNALRLRDIGTVVVVVSALLMVMTSFVRDVGAVAYGAAMVCLVGAAMRDRRRVVMRVVPSLFKVLRFGLHAALTIVVVMLLVPTIVTLSVGAVSLLLSSLVAIGLVGSYGAFELRSVDLDAVGWRPGLPLGPAIAIAAYLAAPSLIKYL